MKSGQDRRFESVTSAIGENLERLREKPLRDLMVDMELELDRRVLTEDPTERRDAIRDVAVREVDLHGVEASVTADGTRLHLAGRSQELDFGLSEGMIEYLHGAHSP